MKLKSITVLLASLFIAASAWSQDFDGEVQSPEVREKIKAARVAYITKRLNLTPRESESFWALHNEYENEKQQLRRQHKQDGTLESMSDDEVKQMIDRRFELQQKLLDLDRAYYKRFQTVISPRKVALYHKADKEFRLELLKRVRNERQNRQRGPGRRFGN